VQVQVLSSAAKDYIGVRGFNFGFAIAALAMMGIQKLVFKHGVIRNCA
jgi:hypothetical protein